VRIPIGLILMVLGIIGIARGAVDIGQQPVNQITTGSNAAGDPTQLPLVPLAAALLFVGGLIILAKKDSISTLDNGHWHGFEPRIVPLLRTTDLNHRKPANVSSY